MDIINKTSEEELKLLTKNQLFLLLFKSSKDELLGLIQQQKLNNKILLNFTPVDYPKKYLSWLENVNTQQRHSSKIDNKIIKELLYYARGYEKFISCGYAVIENEFLAPIPDNIELFVFLINCRFSGIKVRIGIINRLPKDFDLYSLSKIDEDTELQLNAYWSDRIYNYYNPYVESECMVYKNS